MAKNADRSQTVLNLFEKFYGRVYCFARRSVSADIAEDIAQDVFIRLLEHKNLESMEISVSYLLKIADNLMKRRWQREQRFGKYRDRVRAQEPTSAVSVQSNASVILDDESVNEALTELPARERAAVELIICNDLSYEHAAESLGVRVTTVNNWKYRGLQKLKNISQQTESDQSARRDSGRRHRSPARGSVRQQESRTRAPEAHRSDAMLHPEHPEYPKQYRAAAGS